MPQNERDPNDQTRAARESTDEGAEVPERGYVIPGRDFAGASFAADQDEQTADRRGESRRHMSDDVDAGVDDRDGQAPKDES